VEDKALSLLSSSALLAVEQNGSLGRPDNQSGKRAGVFDCEMLTPESLNCEKKASSA